MSIYAVRILGLGLCALFLTRGETQAVADTYRYVDWTEADIAQGTAQGTIELSDGTVVTVSFEALEPDGTSGTLYGAQIDGGTDFWEPTAPYISDEVENPPPDSDILMLSGGQGQIYKVVLSEPIVDPVMAIVSLGSSRYVITYDFDAPFTIVSQGVGYWGGGEDALTELPDDVLEGADGHGTIQFLGTFSTFSWVVPEPETWHGFTFGIKNAVRLEPPPPSPPDAGVADAAVPDATVPDAAVPDAAVPDAAVPDAAVSDAAVPDAQQDEPPPSGGGGGCGGCSCNIAEPHAEHGSDNGLSSLLLVIFVFASLHRGGRVRASK